jgi:hypothetical protein
VPLLPTAEYAQSLGDVARQTRQKQQSKDSHAAPKKVLTDDDMPPHADSDGDLPGPSHAGTHGTSTEISGNSKVVAEQWKAQALAQKTLVDALQKQADKLEASIHFVAANAYRNGAQYNQAQARKQERLRQLQQQLTEEKEKLEKIQEHARQAGFGNAVYDPE